MTRRQLKAVIATRESGFLPWSRKHFFDRPEFERDVKRIEAYYADRGYPNAKVVGVDVKLNDAKDKVAIAVNIDEGAPVDRREHLIRGARCDSGRPPRAAEVAAAAQAPASRAIRG